MGDQYNKILKNSLNINQTLPAVFIDSHYDLDIQEAVSKFEKHTDILLEFSRNSDPIECKNIDKSKRELAILYDAKMNEMQNISRYSTTTLVAVGVGGLILGILVGLIAFHFVKKALKGREDKDDNIETERNEDIDMSCAGRFVLQ